MQRGLLLAGSVLAILCLTSCRNQENLKTELSTATSRNNIAVETDESFETAQNIKIYTLKTEETDVWLPQITLNAEDGTFLFSYDLLSSYLATGTYEQSDGRLKLTTDDGEYRYLFEVIDENTLKYKQEDSSDVELIDKNIGTAIEDGAEFISDH